MEITNSNICELPNAKDTIAGAGQNPIMPHPMPNNADPTIKDESISVRLGNSKSKLSNVLFFFLARLNAKKLINTAEAITNNNDGSQFSPKVKKLIIFEGLVIWARIKPIPKMIPTNKEMITFISAPLALRKLL